MPDTPSKTYEGRAEVMTVEDIPPASEVKVLLWCSWESHDRPAFAGLARDVEDYMNIYKEEVDRLRGLLPS